MGGVSGVSSESLPVSGGRVKQFRKAMSGFGNWVVCKITKKRTYAFESASSELKFKEPCADIKDRDAELFCHPESGLSADPNKIYLGKEDKAARVIQKAVTNWLDNKTLKNDFKHLGLPENMKDTAFGNLRNQSAINLEKIRKELGELTDDEKNILSIIRSVKMRFRHQTGIRLDETRLIMMSPSLRQTEGRHGNHYHNNYVFFSVEFAHEFSNEEPLKTKQTNVDQGPIAYLLSTNEVESRPCLITLCDSFTRRVLYSSFCSGFPIPSENTGKICYKFYDEIPFFIPDHLPSAMALYLIQDVRGFQKYNPSYADMIIEKIYESSSENNNVQEVLNSLMEPEAKVPRMLKSSDFCKKQFRRYSVYEARKFQKMDELLSCLNNNNDCVDLLAEILEGNYAKKKWMKPVFKKIFSMVGREDLPAIKEAYAKISKWSEPGKPANLANYLCYKWNDDNRKLLLDKGIIKLSDQISTPYFDYKATNMKELIKELRK
ncbi:hypothetical protein [uncultured Endozoicomonas sp.]|uniref:hypothetical protein n=1 Tax=uncultured Endozoicomonas sp. TaxID=432652 RepID=UPI0026124956|nr:hypothetical protein [uncultured Endozoicomonas sp.]